MVKGALREPGDMIMSLIPAALQDKTKSRAAGILEYFMSNKNTNGNCYYPIGITVLLAWYGS